MLQISEFSKSIDVTDLTLVDDGVLVFWCWKWENTEDSESSFEESTSHSEITVIAETPLQSDCSDECDEEVAGAAVPFDTDTSPLIMHTVVFKCIGCTKDPSYQETLARVAQLRNGGKEIDCKLEPEPENPIDSEAIAFKCNVDGAWGCVGYVVREALTEVHRAIQEKKITEVSVEWVKFIIYWRTPGWYAGINVTRIGEWSQTVILSQSAKV